MLVSEQYLFRSNLHANKIQLFNYFERPQNRYSSAVHKIRTQYSFQALSQNWEKRLLASSSVCPSAWTDCREIWYLSIFRKYVGKIQVLLKSGKNNGYFMWRPTYILWSHLSQFFLEWETFQTKIVERKSKHTFYGQNCFFFRKSRRLWDNVEKDCRAGQATWQYGACALHAV